MICRNCGHEFEGNYCPNCGQRVVEKRFTLNVLFSQFFGSITNIEHGLWYTLRELILRPGHMILEYLSGKTVRYINPFRFLILVSALSAIMATQFHVMEQTAKIMYTEDIAQSEEQVAMQQELMQTLQQYFNLIVMGLIPFYTMWSLVFFRKNIRSWGEHLIFNIYAVSITQILSAISMPTMSLGKLAYQTHSGVFLILGLVYYAWAAKVVFAPRSWFNAIIKAFLVQALAMITFMLASGIIGTIYAIVLAVGKR